MVTIKNLLNHVFAQCGLRKALKYGQKNTDIQKDRHTDRRWTGFIIKKTSLKLVA